MARELHREDNASNLIKVGQRPGGIIQREDAIGGLHTIERIQRETSSGALEIVYEDIVPACPTNVSATWESGFCRVALTWTNNHQSSNCGHIEVWRGGSLIASSLWCSDNDYYDNDDAGNLKNSSFTYYVRVVSPTGSYCQESDYVSTGSCEA